MVDGASSAEDSPDDNSNLSRTHTATGHRNRPDDSDFGRTRTATGEATGEATGHRKRSSNHANCGTEGKRLAAKRLRHIPFFITSSYYTCTFPHTSFSLLYIRISHFLHVPSLLLLIFQIHKLMHGWVRGMCLCIAYAVIIL